VRYRALDAIGPVSGGTHPTGHLSALAPRSIRTACVSSAVRHFNRRWSPSTSQSPVASSTFLPSKDAVTSSFFVLDVSIDTS
jgi:hypothetical protein